ncbi:hypothetical protein [Streptomyces sp. NBC_00576]|uniref:hypothetical protein n=1 Tax=Streptomyces sp. NBC_00576 TaxID=2903665 RepID=UPI002E80EF22|nr:hypothetical protein [Streptomyces sp. NBC_00576]WUB74770.1 hypothetical protein OG734_34590 [Streptomyces sp. NBC_00576]
MAERSAAALHWLLVPLVLWGLTRLFPPTGTRRKAPTAVRTVVTGKNTENHAHLAARVPAQHRSPYSTDHAPLDGAASRLSRPYLPTVVDMMSGVAVVPCAARVRPYLTARERVARWSRRTALVLASDFGVDLDTRDIHSVLDGVRSR